MLEMRAVSHELKSVGLILARKFSVILDRAQARAGIQSNISALGPLFPVPRLRRAPRMTALVWDSGMPYPALPHARERKSGTLARIRGDVRRFPAWMQKPRNHNRLPELPPGWGAFTAKLRSHQHADRRGKNSDEIYDDSTYAWGRHFRGRQPWRLRDA